MGKVEEYIRHAEECRQLTWASSIVETRRQLLEMANTWEALARERQEQIGRQQRMSALEIWQGSR
jgi:hypothetical protein